MQITIPYLSLPSKAVDVRLVDDRRQSRTQRGQDQLKHHSVRDAWVSGHLRAEKEDANVRILQS